MDTNMNKGFKVSELIIVIVIITVLALIAVPNFRESSGPSENSRVRTHHRTIATSLIAYQADHGTFPPMAPMIDHVSRRDDLRETNALRMTIIDPRFPVPDGFEHADLRDRFSPRRCMPYGYHTDGETFLLISIGHDGVYQITDPSAIYQGATNHPPEEILQLSYDPTNGTRSVGDIILIHP